MKIAILYEILGRSRGGIEAWIYHASEELKKQGGEVTVICAQDVPPEDSVPEGVKILKLPCPPKRFPGLIPWIRALALKKHLKSHLKNFDFVWCRSFTMAWAASRLLGKKKVVYINAAPYSLYGRISFNDRMHSTGLIFGFIRAITAEMSYACAWLVERKAIKKCTNVFLSKARRDETLHFFKLKYNPEQYTVIPPGVNLKRFTPSTEHWNGKGDLKIISVCRLEKDKNIQCVLRAVKQLIDENFSVKFTIVGKGEYLQELKNLTAQLGIDSSVEFAGRQEKVEDFYSVNHVFVLPSLYEGFGSVYIEAMACGLPCIAISAQSGLYCVAADEIIDSGQNGFLMQSDNSKELTEYLKSFYQNPDLLRKFSVAARDKIETSFCWQKTIEQILNLSS